MMSSVRKKIKEKIVKNIKKLFWMKKRMPRSKKTVALFNGTRWNPRIPTEKPKDPFQTKLSVTII